jgi:hypothetical protein
MEPIKKIFNGYFFLTIILVGLMELMSLFGHFFLDIDHWVFVLVILLALILSLNNLKYGVWIILLELFIGSQGYLLHIDIGSVKISLRIALWLVVFSVWFKYFIFSLFGRKKMVQSIFSQPTFLSLANFPYFLLLFFFILLGAVIGYFHNNDWQNIFFDANGWLYFLLIFPFFEVFFNQSFAGENPFLPIWRLLAAGTAWVCLKTFLLFFFFTHAFPESSIFHWLITHELYQWVRDTLAGEITLMPSGFIRVFIQSQIYVLIAFFLGLFAINNYWSDIKKNRRAMIFLLISGALLLGTLIISFSRSFWIGIAAGFILYAWVLLKNRGWKRLFQVSLILLISLVMGVGLIFGVARFPIPKPSVDFDISQALTDRAGKISNEAAVSSRYSLLPILWQKIAASPIWGSGFGTTITYHASDPRILAQNPEGIYTTYAFEWGWLDIWLKLGFFGLLAYLLLFGKIIKDAVKKDTWLTWGLSSGLAITAVVSFFSPYTNHPLGIGYLMLAAAVIYRVKNGSCACG